MKYYKLIKHLESEIEGMEDEFTDRWRRDRHYSDEEVARDKELIVEMECAINILKDQMVEEEYE